MRHRLDDGVEREFLIGLRAGIVNAALCSKPLLVALSGGRDSMALLHGLCVLRHELGVAVRAVHVNHGLATQAFEWERHCVDQCAALNVELSCDRVKVEQTGRGIEDAARSARYAAFLRAMQPGEVLCTAHHQNDQAETVLLRLLRGSGVAGLSAMRASRQFSHGILARPLLGMPEKLIARYARHVGLQWVVDPSNTEQALDRNYLRHTVVPKLEARWPGAVRVLARAAETQTQAHVLLDEVASSDLASLKGGTTRELECAGLRVLKPARLHNVLRYWIAQHGFKVPSQAVIAQAVAMLDARRDRVPVIQWRGAKLTRYRGMLCLDAPLVPIADTQPAMWSVETHLRFAHGELWSERVIGGGLAPQWCEHPLEVRFRTGGERCKPIGRSHSQTLKRLFQEFNVAPWLRSRIPLLYSRGELVCVAGCWVCEGYQTRPGEAGWDVHWRHALHDEDVEQSEN